MIVGFDFDFVEIIIGRGGCLLSARRGSPLAASESARAPSTSVYSSSWSSTMLRVTGLRLNYWMNSAKTAN